MLSPYRAVLATPGAKSFSAAAFLARMPISTMTLGIVLLISQRTDSYALAGTVSAVYMVAAGVSAPLIGRLIDRLGQRPMLLPCFAAFTMGLLGLIFAIELDWPTALLYVFAVASGMLYPPIGACVRARWSYVLEPGPRLHTAFSLEAVIDESIFMLGPVLVTLLAIQVHETAGLLTVLALASGGGLWLASQRATEPPAQTTATEARRPPLGWSWLLWLVIAAICLGALFGSTEVVTVAFADERGHEGATGPLLAVWAAGSLIAGLITGAVQWRMSIDKRYLMGSVAMAIVMVPLPFVDNLVVLAGVLFLAGFAISPTMVAMVSLVEAKAPGSRLTEGITWVTTGLGLGVAPGAALAGHLIDRFGASSAYYVPVASGVLAALVALATSKLTQLASTPQTELIA